MGIHRTWASGLEPFMGPPVGRARGPRALAPTTVGGRGILSPKRPEAAPGALEGLSACFSKSFASASSTLFNTISQRRRIGYVGVLEAVKATLQHWGIGLPSADARREAYGAPETGAAHARQEAPIPRPPGGHGGRPSRCGRTRQPPGGSP